MLEPASKKPLLGQGEASPDFLGTRREESSTSTYSPPVQSRTIEMGAGVDDDDIKLEGGHYYNTAGSSSNDGTNLLRSPGDGGYYENDGSVKSWLEMVAKKHQKKLQIGAVIAVVGILALTLLLTVGGGSDDDDSNGKKQTNIGNVGAWFYPRSNESAIDQVTQANEELGGLRFMVVSSGVNKLVNISAIDDNAEFLYGVSKSTQSKTVVMTLQGPTFAYTENLPDAITYIQNGVKLCQAVNELVGGNDASVCNEIHLDIEPHTLPEWRDGNDTSRQDIINQMSEVVQTSRSAIENITNSIELSIAITWWYFSPNSGLELDNLMQAADSIYIMAYGDTGSSVQQVLKMVGLKTNSTSEIVKKTKYYVGIGVNEFKTVEDAVEASIAISGTLKSDPAYLGNCYYNLNFAMELK